MSDLDDGLKAKAKVAAEAMVSDLRGKQLAKLEEFRAAHANDCETYRFSCEKYGDFLSVKIERAGIKRAAAIHLEDASGIEVSEPGKPAGMEGTIRIYTNNIYDNSGKVIDKKPYASEPGSRGHWPMIYFPAKTVSVTTTAHGGAGGTFTGGGLIVGSGGCGGSGSGNYYGDYLLSMEHCASGATDDEIEFMGSGVTLYVPQGMGKQIYQQILTELGRK